MKPIKISFLFFLWIIFTFQNICAQHEHDSLSEYSNRALHPQNYNDLSDSYEFFNKAYKNSLANKHEERAVYFLYYLASIEYKMGDYVKSEESIASAIGLLDKLPRTNFNEQTRNSFYILMGLNYIEQKNETKALDFYTRALRKANNPLDSAKIYNNVSLIHKEFGNYEGAKLKLKKAFELLPKINDTLTIAKITDNLGVVENEINSANGLELMQRALSLRQAVNDTSTIYTSYSTLADYYYKLNDEVVSKKYALKAYELAEKINAPSYKQDALGLLIRLSEDDYARSYKVLNDSLIKAEKQKDNSFSLMKYDASEANRKALEAELKNEKLENSKLLFILLTVFIALIAILTYFFLRAKHKKDRLQQVFETESRISKQIHDEVANDVFQVMTKLENQTHKRSGLINELHNLYYRTRDISKEYSIIDDNYPFNDYLIELVESFNNEETNVIAKGLTNIEWNVISEIKKITIFKVLQELLINMKKYSEASLVVIIINKEGKKLKIDYSDNGIGTNLKKHTGLQNTENRILAIDGTITFETQPSKGFKVKISI